MRQAAVVTPQPLLVFITTNVSLGVNPALPPGGLQFNRPVLLVGLQSVVTSVDFGMVVNQLNLTRSIYSNLTIVGLVLENLAPGDAVTSAIAAPFSIAIINNLWAAYYNRCVLRLQMWWTVGCCTRLQLQPPRSMLLLVMGCSSCTSNRSFSPR
eukprot:GHRQ01020267.1.p1 GENE.GHRQ01020267.1~~GHRQ01020267.1.p1  ORF type:complete len:154 (-),score=54.63 GHRQ01020267.1:116-577(-)